MKNVHKNPSGRYVNMTDEQLARDEAAFKRAVQRQAEKDEARAKLGRITTDPNATPAQRRNALRLLMDKDYRG